MRYAVRSLDGQAFIFSAAFFLDVFSSSLVVRSYFETVAKTLFTQGHTTA